VRYHTNDELRGAIEAAVRRTGGRADIDAIGRTVKGEPITAARLRGRGDGPRPEVLITGNVHGAEAIGSEVALAVLERLCSDEPVGAAAELLGLADVTVVPAVNLDSRSIAVDAFRAGRWRCPAPRGNARGVDLNRNFPYPEGADDVWYPLAGTSIPWLPWYRGPEPLSEPESRALADLAAARRFAACVNLHSVGRLFLYPYCYSHREPADLSAFLAMGRAYTAAQRHHRYRIKQSRSWYAILGDMDDHLYDAHGTLSVTVELSRPLSGVGLNPLKLLCPFAMMNPRDPGPTIDNNVEACLAALAEGVRAAAARSQASICLGRAPHVV
jgi:predicted deacylase